MVIYITLEQQTEPLVKKCMTKKFSSAHQLYSVSQQRQTEQQLGKKPILFGRQHCTY